MIRKAMVLVAGLCLLAAPAVAGRELHSFAKEFPGADLTGVELEVPVGEVIVDVHDSSAVKVDVVIRTSKEGIDAARAVREISLESEKEGGWLELEVEGYEGWKDNGVSVDVTLRVPASLALKLELGVGEAKTFGLTKDTTVTVGVGECEVTMAASRVRSARATAGVGDASIRLPDKRLPGQGFIGRTVSWKDGTGTAEVELKVGVGEAKLNLD